MTTSVIEPNEPIICGLKPLYEVIGKRTGQNSLGTFDELQDAADFIKEYNLYDAFTIRKVVW